MRRDDRFSPSRMPCRGVRGGRIGRRLAHSLAAREARPLNPEWTLALGARSSRTTASSTGSCGGAHARQQLAMSAPEVETGVAQVRRERSDPILVSETGEVRVALPVLE